MPDCHHGGQRYTTMVLSIGCYLAIVDWLIEWGINVRTFLWDADFLNSPKYYIKVNGHKKENYECFVEFKN